jgi:hypothetical protein
VAVVRSTLCFLAAASIAWAQTPDTASILESARQVALNYSRNLPNFTCNEVISRYNDSGDRVAWVMLDKLTVEVSFSGQREDYKLTARNGKPTDLTLEDVAGTLTRGEFGSALLLIFQPSSGADFQWRRWETVHGRRLAEFTYRVDASKSRYTLKAGAQSVIAGYHGAVSIQPDTGAVFRWSVEAEPPAGFPMTESSVRLEYDHRKIEGVEYLLPVHAEMRTTERGLSGKQVDSLPLRARNAARRPMQHRNLVDFNGYRKFGVESSVTFK